MQCCRNTLCAAYHMLRGVEPKPSHLVSALCAAGVTPAGRGRPHLHSSPARLPAGADDATQLRDQADAELTGVPGLAAGRPQGGRGAGRLCPGRREGAFPTAFRVIVSNPNPRKNVVYQVGKVLQFKNVNNFIRHTASRAACFQISEMCMLHTERLQASQQACCRHCVHATDC